MASLGLESRTLRPTLGAPATGRADAPADASARTTRPAARPGPERSLGAGVAEFVRIELGMFTLFLILAALPLVALLPIAVMGVILGILGALFGGGMV
jgi:hypothetical protein